jgi:multiple sugar transport system permease protein
VTGTAARPAAPEGADDDVVGPSPSAVPVVPAERLRAKRRADRKRRLTVLLLLSPWIIGFLVFTLYPILNSFYWSFTVKRYGSPARWVGLANYELLFTNDELLTALGNTAYLAVFGMPVRIGIALLAAALLVRARRGNGVYRTMFYIPSIVPAVASGALFFFLLKEGGPLSGLFGLFGAEAPLWFRDPQWAKPALIMVTTCSPAWWTSRGACTRRPSSTAPVGGPGSAT